MAEPFAGAQETVATAPSPGEPFGALSRDQQREVFFVLPETVRERLGQDPATSATIFITTATDVLGFFVFLGLAQFVLL